MSEEIITLEYALLPKKQRSHKRLVLAGLGLTSLVLLGSHAYLKFRSQLDTFSSYICVSKLEDENLRFQSHASKGVRSAFLKDMKTGKRIPLYLNIGDPFSYVRAGDVPDDLPKGKYSYEVTDLNGNTRSQEYFLDVENGIVRER